MTLRAAAIRRAATSLANHPVPFDASVLAHDERHLRRRTIPLSGGGKVLVDLPETTVLHHGDVLVLDDGREVRIEAAEEELMEVRARDGVHLARLAWHIGNRHLAAAIEPDRILILRDHVIRAMLEGLGATLRDVRAPFDPLGGAYSEGAAHHHNDHGHDADHGHHHGHHDHRHGGHRHGDGGHHG